MPRLELCGADLSVKLMQTILKSILIKPQRICYFIDSNIVLTWVKNDCKKWKTLITNNKN